MAVAIRVATHADHAILLHVLERLAALDLDTLPAHLRQPRLGLTIHAMLSDPQHAAFYVAEDSDELVAFAASTLHGGPPDGPLYAIINALAVNRWHQIEGLGRVLMTRVHRWAVSRGAEWVELRLPDSDAAIDFYSEMGYARLGQRRMVRQLPPR